MLHNDWTCAFGKGATMLAILLPLLHLLTRPLNSAYCLHPLHPGEHWGEGKSRQNNPHPVLSRREQEPIDAAVRTI